MIETGDLMPDVHDRRAPRLLPCPSCDLPDRVESVPAAHLGGQHEVREPDDEGGTRRRVRHSALSAALAPAPPEPVAGCSAPLALLTLFVGTGLLVAGTVLSTKDRLPEVFQGFGLLRWLALPLLAVGLAALLTAVGRARRYRRETAGRAGAEALWATGWYCGRCAVAYLTPRPGEGVRGLTLSEFRAAVWSAGGYGHLADRHPIA
ncbi:hypothetical protein ACIA8O_20285 [Kitasatospora sp. NPDC051853]|uniref:hypothetical protein n=1 Tax=Kitasatospora sp. NPDC051853 TaxID=3364058 RepID=UPI0037AA7A8F